jgi:hypothetical protein
VFLSWLEACIPKMPTLYPYAAISVCKNL